MFIRNDLLTLIRAQPFVPFKLIRSDGGFVEVLSQEVVAAANRFACVAILDPYSKRNDRWTVVWYLHVIDVEMLDTGSMPMQPPAGPTGSATPAPA